MTKNLPTNSSIKDAATNSPPSAQVSKPYLAPLELAPGSTTPWRYYVRFDHSHTLEAHKKVMGDIPIRDDAPQPEGLNSGTMTDEYRERLRRDPGVIAVWQYHGQGEWF
ncbi:hypothetical protein KCU95_g5866, partial [Aureobasidium melanogenum]